MKKVIVAFAVFFSIGYAVAQVGLCDIITVIKDGKVTNCVVCGAVVSCS
jgi:hypothetical protein